MVDSFLEREKELMKLNESLNSKMTFNLKVPKSAKNVISMNKLKKITANKSSQSDQTKNVTKESNKLKIENSCDVKNPMANDTYTVERHNEKHELDSKDAAFNRVNSQIDDDHQKQCSQIKQILNIDKPQIISNNDKISNALIETIEISGDQKSSPNASHLSLIPSNVFRKNISTDGIIKFLKAKVTILQQELDLSHQENTKNLDNLTKSIEAQKKIEASRSQASNTINTLNAQIQKMHQNELNVQLKLKENESIQQAQRKECDEFRSKLKAAHQLNASLEMRLAKSLDDLERLRKNFRAVKNDEKDLQLTLQNERSFYESQLKIIQRQRSDLIAALKKHMMLVGNLKQQNSCLAQAKCIQMSENEFMKILEWNGSTNINK